MKLELTKKPKNVTLIEGFPGFGLIGTITTEFLIEHLNAKRIGRIWTEELAPMVAVHEGKIIEPLGIFYDEKNKIVILHALTNISGLEWQLADTINTLCKELQVKEIVAVEGVGSALSPNEVVSAAPRAFYFSPNKKTFEKNKINPLKEGIVMGVTGALLLNIKSPLTCIFVETHSKLPDSRASAKAIEVIDKYLNLNVDYKPLLKKAEEFEKKVRELIDTGRKISKKTEQKEETSYFG